MINATIIADSIAPNGKRLTTFELEYPRFIHSELMTHRALSRNAASSRAITLSTMLKAVWSNTATPVHWGVNQSGMQASSELSGARKYMARKIWNFSGKVACVFAWTLGKLGLHKQVANRMLEPWTHIKVVASATDWKNFFRLRAHKDAQPEFQALAFKMKEEYEKSVPRKLEAGQYHLPYLDWEYRGQHLYLNENGGRYPCSLEDAISISVSLCAQVSYRKMDFSLEKAKKICNMLIRGDIVHASPFENVATPAESAAEKSGNFSGWIQHRQTVPNNVAAE